MLFGHRTRRRTVCASAFLLAQVFWLGATAGIAQQVFTVTNNANSGAGSLRQAITDMNNMGVSPNEIRFQISGSKIINLSMQLPAIQRSVTINPNLVAGIVLDGGSMSGNGLVFAESTVQVSSVIGLEIRNFTGAGILIIPTNSNERVNVVNCYVHDNASGVMISSGRFHSVEQDSVIEFNDTDGISVASSVPSVNISDSAIEANGQSGVRLLGSGHSVDGCYIVANGDAEGLSDDFGGVVLGHFGTFVQATDCIVSNSTLAGNTPYGVKIVFGSQNTVSENETYGNTTKGLGVFSSPTALPTLSHFVVDDVHDKIVIKVDVTGTANAQVEVEFFVAFAGTDEGAVFCDDVLISLNSSGQGSALASFNRDEVFQGVAIFPNPVFFPIDEEDRIVATADQTSGAASTSEFSLPANPTPTGDYNLDGHVDTVDYVIWAYNEDTTNAVYTQGDGNFDGTVDEADYDIWRAHYGTGPLDP